MRRTTSGICVNCGTVLCPVPVPACGRSCRPGLPGSGLAVLRISSAAQHCALQPEYRDDAILSVFGCCAGPVVHAWKGISQGVDYLARQLKGAVARFSGANSPRLVNSGDEDLAVTDFTGLGGIDNGLYDTFDHIV